MCVKHRVCAGDLKSLKVKINKKLKTYYVNLNSV